MTPSLTDDQVFAALRAFLLDVLPAGTEVVQGQDNRVAQPGGPNYVVMIASRRELLSATNHDYAPADNGGAISRATAFHFQLDAYGPSAGDNAQTIATLLRDAYGFDQMAGTGVRPLYCDDGQQMPLVNGEQQYEQRWMMNVVLQGTPGISTAVQFADSVRVDIVKAD